MVNEVFARSLAPRNPIGLRVSVKALTRQMTNPSRWRSSASSSK
jgi:hypothetical protein